MDEIVHIFRLLQAQTNGHTVWESAKKSWTERLLLLLLRNLIGRIPFLLQVFISAD